MKIDSNKIIKRWTPKALKLLGNKGKLFSLSVEAINKISDKDGLESLGHDGILAIHLVMDWARGRYKGVKKGNLLKIVIAILYLLSPLDIIPDFILGIGYLDDIAVFMSILKRVHKELEAYEKWREMK